MDGCRAAPHAVGQQRRNHGDAQPLVDPDARERRDGDQRVGREQHGVEDDPAHPPHPAFRTSATSPTTKATGETLSGQRKLHTANSQVTARMRQTASST